MLRWPIISSLTLLPALLMSVTPSVGVSQDVDPAQLQRALRAYRLQHERIIIQELMELLAIPNVARDDRDIRRNAAHLLGALERRGFEAQLLESAGSPPVVYGELRVPGAVRTVMLYAHYDGQPADSRNWETGPWEPVLRDGVLEDGAQIVAIPDSGFDGEWRIYARSASDDKAPVVAALAALDALREMGQPLSVNVKVFLEGEEEAGSSHLRVMLEEHAETLDADVWLFLDGPVHQSRRMQVVYGVRGVIGMQMTVYGPKRVLHSGHYGNWAPNPAVMLSQLVASMRDDEGRILIDDFYDDVMPISAAERRAIAASPGVEAELEGALTIGRTEGTGRLLEQIALPAINVQGLSAGTVGAWARNAIPTEATAAFDFRLVPNQDPERVRALVESHITRLGYTIVTDVPDSATRRQHPKVIRLTWGRGYPAQRTALDAPIARAIAEIVIDAADESVVLVPGLGGSLPMYVFEDVLDRPLIIVPMVNHDNNQHAPNENLRLQNLWDGIEVYGSLLARLGRVWGPTP